VQEKLKLTIILCAGLFLACQTAESGVKTPTPEYHGIYAVQGTDLISLKGGQSTVQPTSLEVTYFSIRNRSHEKEIAFEVSPSVSFLVFEEQPAGRNFPTMPDNIKTRLTLHKVARVQKYTPRYPDRIVQQGLKLPQPMFVHGWLLAKITPLEVELLSKPALNQPGITQFEPTDKLSPGFYLVSREDVLHNKIWWQWLVVDFKNISMTAVDCVEVTVKFDGAGVPNIAGVYTARLPAVPKLDDKHYLMCDQPTTTTVLGQPTQVVASTGK
jgi:hypothetical protein